MSATTDEPIRWLDCLHCGIAFVQARKRGAPRRTCSDECRKARGAHGGLRLTRGASRPQRKPEASPRHSNGPSQAAELGDTFPGGSTNDLNWREHLRTELAAERAAAKGGLCVTDQYGLEPAAWVGITSLSVGPVIGSSESSPEWKEECRRMASKWRKPTASAA